LISSVFPYLKKAEYASASRGSMKFPEKMDLRPMISIKFA
jgi:hypothetical protein